MTAGTSRERLGSEGGTREGGRRRRWLGMVVVGLAMMPAGAQPRRWTVRPEWVRAHEEFLASDALAGRGSATRDEQIAATYVASRFLSYGLKTAPGMAGYLQEAAVVAPELDGQARLKASSLELREGDDLRLLVSSGESVRGPLMNLQPKQPFPAKVAPGAVLLLREELDAKALGDIVQAARKAKAAAILVPEGAGPEELSAQWGGGTRVPKRLAERPAAGGTRPTLVALKATALQQMSKVPAGETITVAVTAVSPATPRMTYNAVGYLPGSDPASGTLLLSAHLDHLGIRGPVAGDGIYNGANDDAAGTTAVLELAHALAAGPRLRRSVLFVCYGSEEIGELGSEYFGSHPPVALKSLVANLEFEMIGAQDPKMPKNTLLLTGWDRSNLGPELRAHGARLGPDPYPEQHFFERSDNYQLALEGVVAHTAAGFGTVSTYHQPNDDLAHLDLPFMTKAIQSLIEPLRWLAESEFKPVWSKEGQPHR